MRMLVSVKSSAISVTAKIYICSAWNVDGGFLIMDDCREEYDNPNDVSIVVGIPAHMMVNFALIED